MHNANHECIMFPRYDRHNGERSLHFCIIWRYRQPKVVLCKLKAITIASMTDWFRSLLSSEFDLDNKASPSQTKNFCKSRLEALLDVNQLQMFNDNLEVFAVNGSVSKARKLADIWNITKSHCLWKDNFCFIGKELKFLCIIE